MQQLYLPATEKLKKYLLNMKHTDVRSHPQMSSSAFRKFLQMPSLVSPCEHKFLPLKETLKSWKKQLQGIIAIGGLFPRNQ